jgi:hypothetical protein
MPAVSGSTTQVKTSSTTAADLAGTPDDAFQEGDLACVTDLWPNSTFRLRRTALGGAPDNVTSIATFSGNGYWEVFGVGGGGGMLVFETIGDLAAYDDSATDDGILAYVQSVRSIWQRRVQVDPGTADGITNVQNPANDATWYRSIEASPSWLDLADWSIDGANGDDEGEGTALDPLLTHDEFMRRLGQNKLTQDLVVNFVADADAGFNFSHATVPGQHNGFRVLYKGPDLSALTPVYTDTFAGFQAISRLGTGTRTEFTSVLAKATWDTYIGKLVVVTAAADPAVVGAYAWVCATQQSDDTVVITTPFIQAAPGNTDPLSIVDPSNDDTYVVVDPLAISFTNFLISTTEIVSYLVGPTSVLFQNLALDLNRSATVASGTTSLFSSWIYGLRIEGPASVFAWGCDLLSQFKVVRGGAFTAEACFIDGVTGGETTTLIADDVSATVSVLEDCVIMGDASLEANGGRLNITSLGAFDVDTDVVNLNAGACAFVQGYIYFEGSASNYFDLRSGTRVISGALLLATTVGPNVAFGGVVTQDWGGLPFVANALITDSHAAWLNDV